MPRHAPELECSIEDKASLLALVKSRTAEARAVERARIILACVKGGVKIDHKGGVKGNHSEGAEPCHRRGESLPAAEGECSAGRLRHDGCFSVARCLLPLGAAGAQPCDAR